MSRTLDIAVFGSGKGSNFRAILNAIQQGKIPGARICLVVSNNSKAGILETARANAIPAEHASEKNFASEAEFIEHLLTILHNHGVNFIVLAGYMKKLHPRIVETFRNRIINIHPALLPQFGGKGMFGMRVHEAVIASGQQYSGATIHIVNEEYDRGPTVLQKRVTISPDDTAETLAAKVLEVEHELYPVAIRIFAEEKVTVNDDTVVIRD